MDLQRLGLILLALAPVAWIVGAAVQGGGNDFLGLGAILVGLALAAWAWPAGQRVPAVAGFCLGAVGILLFYGGVLWDGLASVAGGIFALGCLVAAGGCWRTHAGLLAGGLFAIAFAGLFWVVADGVGGLTWQPGNVLALVGASLAGLGALKR
ncbi:MAG TPA: hypothetical protein VM286_09860 [Candidatus Thermoplasmatota archaeon]|nr:hypothetical protein [Candidatus Thermoplasmatota archaeon]